MTRIDFHFNAPDKLQYGCRLVRKVYRAHHKVLVWWDDPVRLAEFDRMLWAFSQQEFIPHVSAIDPLADETPVLLAAEPAETAFHEVLINLGSATPPMFSRFDRLIEVVATGESDRDAARERWRFYRDRGYPMHRHDLSAG
ncbi:MAG: DNA polymerase III subunit chi [Burkholderiales bacterium]|nr:MAG: DNA polymerase III subunit chi [Burkholderiales bacterium]